MRVMSEILAFLRTMLIGQYGDETAGIIFSGYSKRRPVTFRVNTLKADLQEVVAFLSDAGIRFSRPAWNKEAFILQGVQESDIRKTEIYKRGEIYLQSLSSMLPPLFLAPEVGENILDMTAAPGGKTTQIAALTCNKAFITACEKDKIRAQRLKFNIEKMGAKNITVMNVDATKLDDFFRFDKILLDAPCSGSGTLDLSYPLCISEKLIRNCAALQEKLLFQALKMLRKGGEIIYSTCSVLKQENADLVKRVVSLGGAEIVPLKTDKFRMLPIICEDFGSLTVCPNELYEGFFISKIRKLEER